MIGTPKQVLHKVVRPRFMWLIAALALSIQAIAYWQEPFGWQAEQNAIEDTGLAALIFFMASFSCTPLVGIVKRRTQRNISLTAARRWFGLLSATFAALHLALLLSFHYADSPWFTAWLKPMNQVGAAAFLCLTVLALTSFPAVVRLTKLRWWKTLHRLVYAIFFLLFIHVILNPHASIQWTVTCFGGVACLRIIGAINSRIP